MIAQEKKEHKNRIKSIQSSNVMKNTNEDCPLLGQPAMSVEKHGAVMGWSNDDLEVLEVVEVVHPVLQDIELLPAIPPSSNTGGTKCKTSPPSPSKSRYRLVSFQCRRVHRILPEIC
jgi:hypothetical protein